MRKVFTVTRNGIPGVYVEWYDDLKRRRSKYFAPQYQKLAKHFATRKFTELNSDTRPVGAVIDVDWGEFVDLYLKSKKADNLTEKNLSGLRRTLDLVHDLTNIPSTKHLSAATVQKAKSGILEKLPSPNSANKYLRDLKAAINWGKRHSYIDASLEVDMVKARQKPVRILAETEIVNLLAACGDDQPWRMRILLALVTGLRRTDLDNLTLRDISIEQKTVTCRNLKTGKVTNYQPLPDAVMPHIERYILEVVADGQERLFLTKWSKKWYTIIKQAGLPGLQFHDLRRTFASLQANAGTPLATVQEMLGHGSIETTMKHYIKTGDTAKRDGVNKLQIEKWL